MTLFIRNQIVNKKPYINNRAFKTFIMKKLLAFALIIIVFLSSCRTSGYGCKGRTTWKQMVERANRPY